MPFGEDFRPTSERYKYTGKEDDISTGLHYFNARYYDPAIGRFITEDPAKDGINWYVYCGNSPLGYVDPDGENLTDAYNYIVTYQPHIQKLSKKYDVPVSLINAVIFKENELRNLTHTTKDVLGVTIKGDASLGVCQIRMSTAAFLDLEIDPKDHASLDYKNREIQKNASLMAYSGQEKRNYITNLLDPFKNIEYATRYLEYLYNARGGYPDKETWLSDYNRGLTLEDLANNYGLDYEYIKTITNNWISEGDN